MSIKVFITREFKNDGIEDAFELLMELRSLATVRKGYISGETLVSTENPNKVVVVSSWVSPNRWEEWKSNPKRIEFGKKLESHLTGPEKHEVFHVGSKPPEWVDMA